jgi:nitroimidazol reductase NimA-like FMN-containing flavoprotein (pyridoxamine 5'-phosphate oxidase superfamily)
MQDLTREHCLQLLANTTVGRVAINAAGAAPVIRPVNYLFDEPSRSVLFRTAAGSKLHALVHAAAAAFEIDGIDPTTRTGWSVIIVGVTEEVTNPTELRHLEEVGLDAWAPGAKSHWVRIRATTVSGRRIISRDG